MTIIFYDVVYRGLSSTIKGLFRYIEHSTIFEKEHYSKPSFSFVNCDWRSQEAQ